VAEIFDLRRLEASIAPLLAAGEALTRHELPATRHALKRAAAYVERTWIDFASGHPIPGTDRTVNSTEYRNGITKTQVGRFAWIIHNTAGAVADRVEDGTPKRDLKEEVATWRRRRETNDGLASYAHIPFRHKVAAIKKAAAKSPGLARRITRMKKSRVVGRYKDKRGIMRNAYRWGARVKSDPELDVPARLVGMVRFEASAGKAGSSVYMTFRTVSTRSPAGTWIIKKKDGVPMVQKVREATEQRVTQMVAEGLDTDLGMLG